MVCVMSSMVLLSSCYDKVICPSYQSTYILDDSVRQTYFSYLWKLDEGERQAYLAQQVAKDTIEGEEPDNVPRAEYFAYVEPHKVPERDLKKTKFGIVRYTPYLVKNYQMRTVPMENVLGLPVEEVVEEEGEFYASDFADTTAIAGADSLYSESDTVEVDIPLAVRSEDKGPKYLYKYDPENRVYNMDQVYYNKYFGESLIPKPKPPAPIDSTAVDSVATGEKVGFFKRLFGGGKASVEIDSTYNVDALIESTENQLNGEIQTESDTTQIINDGFGTDPIDQSGNDPEPEEEDPNEGFGDPIKEEEEEEEP